MGYELSTLLACIGCLMAAFAVAVRGMILAPATQTWPEGPRSIRICMFTLSAVLTWAGMTLFFKPAMHHVDWMVSVALLAHAGYQIAMLVNIVRQNYPSRFWRAMNRIQKLASCQPVGSPFSHPWFAYDRESREA